MLCTDGVIIFMYPHVLLDNYSILPYWWIVCAYTLYISYKSIQIFIVYRCMLYYMECLYHFISFLIIFKIISAFAFFIICCSYHHTLLIILLQGCVFWLGLLICAHNHSFLSLCATYIPNYMEYLFNYMCLGCLHKFILVHCLFLK